MANCYRDLTTRILFSNAVPSPFGSRAKDDIPSSSRESLRAIEDIPDTSTSELSKDDIPLPSTSFTTSNVEIQHTSAVVVSHSMPHTKKEELMKVVTRKKINKEDRANQFIYFKEYSEVEHLFYSSEDVHIVGTSITLLERKLPSISHTQQLKIVLASLRDESLSFSWLSCQEHFHLIKESIITVVCQIGIPWYCKRISRDLRSSRQNRKNIKKLRHE